jgi:hypothetical protein
MRQASASGEPSANADEIACGNAPAASTAGTVAPDFKNERRFMAASSISNS